MEVEMYAIGGYDKIGANMTVVNINGTIIVLDVGLHVDKIVSFGEREDINSMPVQKLYEIGAIPDDRVIDHIRDKVKAIIISHAHLDHVGAAHILAGKYNAPIYGTPFTIKLLRTLMKDANIILPNDLKQIPPNSSIKISKDLEIEFLNITHSVPQSSMIVLKTPKGNIVYTSDFKFDNFPIIGKRPDYKKLKELGKEGVLILISETTRANEESKTPSEIIAKYMLYDVLTSIDSKGIIVTTFSSHIARLKSLVEISYELGREPIIIGRSLAKYLKIAEELGFYNFSEVSKIYGVSKDFPKVLKEVSKSKEEYLLLVTGHQGELGSVLDRMAKEQLLWEFKDTTVVFSTIVIPTPINQANRQLLEERLRRKGAHIIKDVHVSGHAKREDHRMLLRFLNPEYIFPAHGDIIKRASYVELASEYGYIHGEDIFLLQNGQKMKLEF